MVKRTRTWGTVAIACCLMAVAVSAQAAMVRVEAEAVPYSTWGGQWWPPYVVHDVAASGEFYIHQENSWIYFENIVAPADGTYNITFRMADKEADQHNALIIRNLTSAEIWLTGCGIGDGINTFHDFTFACDLNAGANTIEFGGCQGWASIDYIEFDDATGLQYVPVPSYHPLRLEAESGTQDGTSNTAAMSIVDDAGASGGQFLRFTTPGGTAARIEYTFTVPNIVQAPGDPYPGLYCNVRVGAKHKGGDPLDGSLILNIDGDIFAKPFVAYLDTEWHEHVYRMWLDAGEHTFTLISQWGTLDVDYIQVDGIGTDDNPVGDITLTGVANVGETITLAAPPTTCALDGGLYYWVDPLVPWNFQWMLDGEPIAGATDRVLTIEDLSSADSGSYTVSYRVNEGTPVVSKPFAVNVTAAGAQPIVSDPAPGWIVAGGPLTLTAPAGAVSYQWVYNGANMIDTDSITGTNSRVLVFSPVTMDDAGTYTCVYDDGLGKAVLVTPGFELEVLAEGSLPVAGLAGLAALAAALATVGAIRRKK